MDLKGKAFEYHPSELLKWLFIKKYCPKCGEKLTRTTKKIPIKTKDNWVDMAGTMMYANLYKLIFLRYCKNCRRIYDLQGNDKGIYKSKITKKSVKN